jgi:ankyrin repeat protein
LAVVIELLGHEAIIDINNESKGATTSILATRKSRGGANIEAKDHYGETPLHSAGAESHVAIVQALLAVEADCRAANNEGKLPIRQAVAYGNSEGAKYLRRQY